MHGLRGYWQARWASVQEVVVDHLVDDLLAAW
jgi:hypothetical protein